MFSKYSLAVPAFLSVSLNSSTFSQLGLSKLDELVKNLIQV